MRKEQQRILLSRDHVAAELDITQDQLALLIERGEFTEVRLRGRRRYRSDEVADLKEDLLGGLIEQLIAGHGMRVRE
ncbi:MAG TPA: hypothetical protein VIH91_12565 [Terriglobales bacterium]